MERGQPHEIGRVGDVANGTIDEGWTSAAALCGVISIYGPAALFDRQFTDAPIHIRRRRCDGVNRVYVVEYGPVPRVFYETRVNHDGSSHRVSNERAINRFRAMKANDVRVLEVENWKGVAQ